ncbi:MAG: hypothetical protein IPG64_11365 [Haliea sp.]|nr:hypothetical protein [Haliea sp.]
MKYRVIQWGTDNVVHSLRHLIRHLSSSRWACMLTVRGSQGLDAAAIAGFAGESTGVLATNDVDALLALKPDVVVYTANGELRPTMPSPTWRKSLRAGINVASNALIYLVYPPHAGCQYSGAVGAGPQGSGQPVRQRHGPGLLRRRAAAGGAAAQRPGRGEPRAGNLRLLVLCRSGLHGHGLGFGRPESEVPIMALPGILARLGRHGSACWPRH